VFALVVFNRLWMAHLYPFPAWSDSLHHTLLTQLTAQSGRLPLTLEPYAPIPLEMYHLGLYALAGPVQILAEVPAHMALLWTAQFFNALCIIGVFLALDALAGRKAALVGSLVVGLFSFQPAWYINWGRFTQAAGQAVLLVGWFVTYEAIRAWTEPSTVSTLKGLPLKVEKNNNPIRAWMGRAAENPGALVLTLAAALLNAGIFELHFRVAGFYLPLLFLSTAWQILQAARARRARWALAGIAAVGVLSVLLILPVALDGVQVYLRRSAATAAAAAARTGPRDLTYYSGSPGDIFALGLQPWLLAWAALSAVILVLRRRGWGIGTLLWVVLLWLEGHAYLLDIPALSFTNYGAILILYYLPAGLLIGLGAQELLAWLPRLDTPAFHHGALTVLLTGAVFASHIHSQTIDAPRYFVTPADLPAMDWINANTPPDALFAVNTYFWMKDAAHGVDAGYWIPYFTGRQTTASVMLYPYGPPEYREKILALSRAAASLAEDPAALDTLCQMGVDYLYLGANRYPTAALSAGAAAALPGARLVYDQDGVKIFRLCGP